MSSHYSSSHLKDYSCKVTLRRITRVILKVIHQVILSAADKIV